MRTIAASALDDRPSRHGQEGKDLSERRSLHLVSGSTAKQTRKQARADQNVSGPA